jgi:glycosyltransferase involved in cell wall biosynthesis
MDLPPIPKITVVTPSYNQGEFIEDAIRSVVSQRGEFLIEYLIMDGGSTDGSVEAIERWGRALREGGLSPGCRGISYDWVSGKDGGQADAIAKAFERATGDIGVWLNSDDAFYSDGVFESVIARFRASGAEMIVGDGIIADRRGRPTGVHRTRRINLRELMFLDHHMLQPSVFLAMPRLKAAGIDASLEYVFDADLFLRLLHSGISYEKVPELFSLCRVYPETKTSSGMGRRLDEAMLVCGRLTDKRLLLKASRVYRYIDIVLRARYGGSRLFMAAFVMVRAFFYLMITGRPWRV